MLGLSKQTAQDIRQWERRTHLRCFVDGMVRSCHVTPQVYTIVEYFGKNEQLLKVLPLLYTVYWPVFSRIIPSHEILPCCTWRFRKPFWMPCLIFETYVSSMWKKPFNIVSWSTLENIYAFPFKKLVKKGLIRNYIDRRLPDFYHFILPKKVSLKHRSDLEEYMDPKIHIWIGTTLGYLNHTLKRLTCHKGGCNESDSSTTSAIQDISVAYMSLLNLRIYLNHYIGDMSCAGVRTWPMDRCGDVHTE